MRNILFVVFILGFPALYAMPQPPVPVIFDTDIAPDYDDVGAMALLHAFADKGEVEILATISSNAFETTVPTLSVLNTYFGRPEIPIGVTKRTTPDKACSQKWAEAIVAKYPHKLRSNEEAEDAVHLYRKILSGQPDSSVTIITVGFFTNLADLLNSGPDSFSELDGLALVKRKVKRLVSMAARIGEDGKTGKEFNVVVDAVASKKVFEEWPTPFLISGFEIGEKILTGINLIHNDSIQNSPVKDAFTIALTKDNNTKGRNSWDQTAVLAAVKGLGPWFGSKSVNFTIEDDGTNVLIPGERFQYITFKATPGTISAYIEKEMMHQPGKAGK